MNINCPAYNERKRTRNTLKQCGLLILFVLFTFNALGNSHPSIESISLFEDASKNLSFSEIHRNDSLGLFKDMNPVTSLAYTGSNIWIKIVVSNHDDKSYDKILRWKKSLTHLVCFYETDTDGVYHKSISGYAIPDSDKEVISNAICFPITLQPNSKKNYFLQVRSPYSIEIDISLIDKIQLEKDERDFNLFAGAVIFALIVISLYNLFLGIGLKDSMYFHFVITNIGDTLSMAAMLAVMPLVFPFLPFARTPFFNAASIGVFGALSANFVIQFLKLKQNHRVWYWVLLFVIIINLLAIVHGTISYYKYDGSYNLIAPIHFFTIPTTFVVCVVSYFKGNRDTRFLLIGLFFLMVGAISKLLTIQGIISGTWFTNHFIYIADVLESVLLSFALADRYNRIQNEKLKLEIDLRTKDKDISLLAANNKVRFNERKIFLSDLQELAKIEPENLPNKLRSLIFNLVQKLDSEGKLMHKADNIQVLNAEFESKIKSSFPELSQSDIELCGYIKLNMSVKEIADIKRTTEAAIKMARYRLKAKLQLDDIRLDDYIQINF